MECRIYRNGEGPEGPGGTIQAGWDQRYYRGGAAQYTTQYIQYTSQHTIHNTIHNTIYTKHKTIYIVNIQYTTQ